MNTYVERRRTTRAIRVTPETTVADVPGAIDAGGSILYPDPSGGFKPLGVAGYLIEVGEGTYRHETAMSFEHDWAPVTDT